MTELHDIFLTQKDQLTCLTENQHSPTWRLTRKFPFLMIQPQILPQILFLMKQLFVAIMFNKLQNHLHQFIKMAKKTRLKFLKFLVIHRQALHVTGHC